MWKFVLLLLTTLVLWAQDAGMVLRTSVGYNTQKGTLQLSEEQRREADRFGQEARAAGMAGKYGEAMRLYHHGTAMMQGAAWTPEVELAASLQAKVDHAMAHPGGKLTVSLAPLYPAAAGKLSASVFLRPAAPGSAQEQRLAAGAAVEAARLPVSLAIAIPDAPPGNYLLEIRLAAPDGSWDRRAKSAFVKPLPVHVEALAPEVERLRARVARVKSPSAEYALILFERADRGDANPHRFDFRREFAAANAILDAMEAGRDPFAGRHGDIRKAYRSAVDQTLQPYRLFVPEAYDGARSAPLVMALHGMGGDENSMFDAYGEGALKREADRLGFLVACPKGREPASMYRGTAEQDVLDVLAEVRRDYRVDPRRIYLMGHSMGAFGTWSIAMDHPDLFAALGPFAGGGNPAAMEKIRHIPQYVVHGDNDKTVAVAQSRAMVEAGKKTGAKIVYVEVPGGGHGNVVAPQFRPMLEFFAAQAKTASYQPTWESIDKRPTPPWFTDAKFGIFIHWGVYSVPAYAPVIPGKLAYAEWYWNAMTAGKNDPKANPVQTGTWAYHQKQYGADFPYQNFAPQFRAELFDPDHWAAVFARSGAKYVVLTSKHHEGFALWPSKEASATWGRPWNAVATGPQRDLLGDLTAAVRAKGLRMGYYYSLYEWYNPLWLSDKPRYINDHMFPQFKDLVTRYRPSIIFSDGEWDLPSAEWRSPELLAWLFNESPVKDDVVINDRWGKDSRHKHGGYWTTEYTPGMSGLDHAWEESRGMGFSYGYNRAENLEHYNSGRQLVIMLVDLVSHGGNLLLDIGPDADGAIPVVMEERLTQIGDWLKVNGEAIYGTKPWKATRQWSAGEVPKIEYNKEYEAAYDVTKLAAKPEPGKASIEAFFTSKGSDVFAILPRWPGRGFQVKDVTGVKSVSLLGAPAPLKFEAANGGVAVELPDLPEELLSQPAWVLKLNR